ncbi:hypothetical protein SCHPADRAFT_620372 [Schizopora paradoxa]|uniref:Fungal-type protein kinase domain-containing protein n=1 Tax=Schizopora paradoxa TaxID=27342 RepID=A0A0H2R8D7_9AGAM|nr:hypothetical protein SCHPADRAFT_620372 [Schizopora paradoxa]
MRQWISDTVHPDNSLLKLYCTGSSVRRECRSLSDTPFHSPLINIPLAGWLALYLSGYMHGNISIGNVFLLSSPITRERFNMDNARIPWEILKGREFENVPQAVKDRFRDVPKPSITDVDKTLETIKEIEDLACELGISIHCQCKALLSDDDLSVYLPTYLTQEHSAPSISGTFEFMSYFARMGYEEGDIVDRNRLYFQNPLDDLESFLWVGVWACFFNNQVDCEKIAGSVRMVRDQLGDSTGREDAWARIRRRVYVEKSYEGAHVLGEMARFLIELRPKVDDLFAKFYKICRAKPTILQFDQMAFEGVLIFMELYKRHFSS